MAMTLAQLVAKTYPAPEWAVFYEVSNSTGWRARRRADAVALGVWPSRGHALVGFEFKEDRRDWLREKMNPAKAEEIAAHCDVWYVVASNQKVVRPEELPDRWGLYVADEKRERLVSIRGAVPFPNRDSEAMARSFAAAMLRKVPETTVPKASVQRMIDDAVRAALARTREGHEAAMLRAENERLRAALDAFREATGVDLLNGWRGPHALAYAVKVVLDGDRARESVEEMRKRLEASARAIGDALAGWPR